MGVTFKQRAIIDPRRVAAMKTKRSKASEPSRDERIEAAIKSFWQWLSAFDYKHTTQRDLVARVVLGHDQPLTCDQLIAEVRAITPQVGHTTVYRTLKLLVAAGLVKASEPVSTTYVAVAGGA